MRAKRVNLTDEQVLDAYELWASEVKSISELARSLGVRPGALHARFMNRGLPRKYGDGTHRKIGITERDRYGLYILGCLK